MRVDAANFKSAPVPLLPDLPCFIEESRRVPASRFERKTLIRKGQGNPAASRKPAINFEQAKSGWICFAADKIKWPVPIGFLKDTSPGARMKYRRVRMALNNLVPLRTEEWIYRARLGYWTGGGV
jgi:hypothetical protein